MSTDQTLTNLAEHASMSDLAFPVTQDTAETSNGSSATAASYGFSEWAGIVDDWDHGEDYDDEVEEGDDDLEEEEEGEEIDESPLSTDPSISFSELFDSPSDSAPPEDVSRLVQSSTPQIATDPEDGLDRAEDDILPPDVDEDEEEEIEPDNFADFLADFARTLREDDDEDEAHFRDPRLQSSSLPPTADNFFVEMERTLPPAARVSASPSSARSRVSPSSSSRFSEPEEEPPLDPVSFLRDFFRTRVPRLDSVYDIETDRLLQRAIQITFAHPAAFRATFTEAMNDARRQVQRSVSGGGRRGRRRRKDKTPLHKLLVFVMCQTATILQSGSYAYASTSGTTNTARVRLNPTEMSQAPTSSVFYDHSTLQRVFYQISRRRKFGQTVVYVTNEDCLDEAQSFVNFRFGGIGEELKRLNPIVLNMAASRHANGGWRYGHVAQEEDLTRRSNYCQFLSREFVGDGRRTGRRNDRYEVPEFGGVYSPRVCFFRGNQAEGYPLLEEPFHVSCVAVAAYNRPRVFDANVQENTKRKIRAILGIAVIHGHDVVVLSALGCGAFRNPPDVVGRLFQEVIRDEFAGYFRQIRFAIIGDENDIHGNFNRFREVFGNTSHFPAADATDPVFDSSVTRTTSVSFQGERVLGVGSIERTVVPRGRGRRPQGGGRVEELGWEEEEEVEESSSRAFPSQPSEEPDDSLTAFDVGGDLRATIGRIFHQSTAPIASSLSPNSQSSTLQKCRYGGICRDINDPAHARVFSHPELCSHGAGCMDYSQQHSTDVRHPPPCRYGGRCRHVDRPHYSQFRHPMPCRDGQNCRDHSAQHCFEFRHAEAICKFGDECWDHDLAHHKFFIHSFLPPCPDDKKCQKKRDRKHCQLFSHRCWYGSGCRKKKDQFHCFKYYHPISRGRHAGAGQVSSVRHGDRGGRGGVGGRGGRGGSGGDRVLGGRPVSRGGGRRGRGNGRRRGGQGDRRGGGHARGGRAGRRGRRRVSKADPYATVRGDNRFVQDFEGNKKMLFGDLNRFFRKHNRGRRLRPRRSVVELAKSFRPVHRLDINKLKGVIAMNGLTSASFQDYIVDGDVKQKKRAVYTAIKGSPVVGTVLRDAGLGMIPFRVRSLIKAIVDTLFVEKKALGGAMKRATTCRNAVTSVFPRINMNRLQEAIIAVAEAVKKTKRFGIRSKVDQKMKTNLQVFSIVGHHTGSYGPIFLVFHPSVMHHPDFNVTPTALTAFNSGSTFTHDFGGRVWAAHRSKRHRNETLAHRSKMHPCMGQDFYTLLALEMTGQWCVKNGKNGTPKKDARGQVVVPDVRQILKLHASQNSHCCFEGHMPSFTPLSFVERLIIDESNYSQLSREEKTRLQRSIGRGRIQVVSLRDLQGANPNLKDVGRSLLEYATRRKWLVHRDRRDQWKGLAFTLEDQWGEDKVVPVFFPHAGHGEFEFLAKGCDIHIGLSATRSSTFRNPRARTYHIVLNSHESYLQGHRESTPLSFILSTHVKGGGRKLASAEWFAGRDYEDEFVKYTIQYSERIGVRVLCGRKILAVASGRNTIKGLQYLTVSCWNRRVMFRNFAVNHRK